MSAGEIPASSVPGAPQFHVLAKLSWPQPPDADDDYFVEKFQESVETLPAMLHKNYSLMRELDKSLQGVQLENEQRCQQEIEDIKHGLESGSITTYEPAKLKFSDEAIEEQKHCVRIADEKVALATQTYDLVDAHIQQLDQFMRKLEELRLEKEAAAAAAAAAAADAAVAATSAAPAGAGTFRSAAADPAPKTGRTGERSRGGRKKAKVPMELPTEQPPIDLELPVDPNEPTYCFCNQVSYGEMVACDNPDCKIEWFHFGCVGLKEQPRGKWYCLSCSAFQKKRKGR
ncbi:PHD finger protein ING1 isoform X1 [Hordeum vulgare subsp. vulgare]|uniref:PHD finger protein ING1 isoform X1 n=1 Tax=Hordeum vulgare subsp. vulgare TaxID=112509 RepID=UPI000295254F|nr:PHD finger protein ING1 isoform X1 [Hordeum vulgare subsp. vulgare]